MLKQSRKALSLQLLSKHQDRIRRMVSRIDSYRPVQHNINKPYATFKKYRIEKRIEQRQKQSDKLFEENMKIIYRIETTGPKVETKKFPEVKQNPRRLKSLSSCTSQSSKNKFRVKDVFRNEGQLFQENMKIITNIECTGPKIQCWTSKKTRQLHDLMIMRKREEEKKILDKFKDISKEFSKISRNRSFKSRSSLGSANTKSKSIFS